MSLDSISPIDGRYRNITEPLAQFFSERAFIEYRVRMEEAYLRALAHELKLKDLKFKSLKVNAEEIKKIEQTTNHDLKAIEYWMRSKLPKRLGNWVHFGLTSEDATNIAYALMISDALRKVIIPALDRIFKVIHDACYMFRDTPMLARTHGQPASPTTFGKEMAVFTHRLARQLKQLKAWRAQAKLNGATGNYNALVAAYPKVDWIAFSKKFIASLGLEPNLLTTQIAPYDHLAELFDTLRRINVILLNFNQDMWRYISDGWIAQKAVRGEVGSSTMPHKINPWFFENSEGNLGVANAFFQHLALKLPVSRLQRDLSDSTVMRSVGTAFGHCLIAYEYVRKALGRIDVDAEAMRRALADHPEVLAEAVQTVLRREGMADAYEKLKDVTRGRVVTLADLHRFIDQLPVRATIRRELKALAPETYVGLAPKLAQR